MDLLYAVRHVTSEYHLRLIQTYLDKDRWAANRWTLVYALHRGNNENTWGVQTVLYLLDVRPDLAQEPVMLHIAARHRCVPCIFRRLVSLYPQNVTAVVYDGNFTSLHTAVIMSPWTVLDILLSAVPDVHQVPPCLWGGGSVFHRLCERGDIDIFVRFMHKVGVCTSDPLFQATAESHPEDTPWSRVQGELACHVPNLAPSRKEALYMLEAVSEVLLPDVADIVVGFLSMAQHSGLVQELCQT